MTKYFDEYMKIIHKKIQLPNAIKSKLKKINTDKIQIPTSTNIDLLTQYKYNASQLKCFLKHYKLKMSGNKEELLNRLYYYLSLSKIITKLQKIFRGHIQRSYNYYQGPAALDRSICVNDTDFLTMDELKDIPNEYFFSFRDDDNFIYGFNIISLHNLLINTPRNQPYKNPYNREDIHPFIINHFKIFTRISKILKYPINLTIEDPSSSQEQRSTASRISDLFQNMDSLGNYTSQEWFTALNSHLLVRFVRELGEIWNYRASITTETKRKICPPSGDPFRNFSITIAQMAGEIDELRDLILNILEKMVNTGIDNDSKCLGSYYVLGALTLVNENAALALPWLHDSFSYI
jgi:hypothetical protein